jgi:hypothetical protein
MIDEKQQHRALEKQVRVLMRKNTKEIKPQGAKQMAGKGSKLRKE